jgi:hypothetical protein
MSDTARNTPESAAGKVEQPQAQDDDRMLDEEKILAGRDDVNYPAHLTKDVQGG